MEGRVRDDWKMVYSFFETNKKANQSGFALKVLDLSGSLVPGFISDLNHQPSFFNFCYFKHIER